MRLGITILFAFVAQSRGLAADLDTKDRLGVLFDACRSDLARVDRNFSPSPAKAALDSALKDFLSRAAARHRCSEAALLRDSLPGGIALTLSAPETSWGRALESASDTSHAVSIRGYRMDPFCAYIIRYSVVGRYMVSTAPLVIHHGNGPVLVSDERQLSGISWAEQTMDENWHCFGVIAHRKDSALVLVLGPAGSGQFSFLHLCRRNGAALRFSETDHQWPGLGELRNTGKALVIDGAYQDRTEPDENKSIKSYHETVTAADLFTGR